MKNQDNDLSLSLSYSLAQYVLCHFKLCMVGKPELALLTAQIEDEEREQFPLTIYSGQFLQEEDYLRTYFAEIDIEQLSFLFLLKKNQPWYAIRLDQEQEEALYFKRYQQTWLPCSMAEQLRLGLSFEMIFESGLALQPNPHHLDTNILFEILEKE